MQQIKKMLVNAARWPCDLCYCLTTEYVVRKHLKKLPPQKYLLMGFARHGKDTVAEMMNAYYGIKFKGSTLLAAERIVFPRNRYKYKTVRECYNDRGNHREMWFKLIQEYNKRNKTAFIELVLQNSDIYCGLRCQQEFLAAKDKQIFDYVLWVDASKRKPPESSKSCTVSSRYADTVLDNNTSKMSLRKSLATAMRYHVRRTQPTEY